MPKHTSRYQSSIDVETETKRNLFELGLLNTDPTKSDTASNRSIQRKTCPCSLYPGSGILDSCFNRLKTLTNPCPTPLDQSSKGRYQGPGHRGAPSVGSNTSTNFKQASITSGTLGRQHTPNNSRNQRARIPPPRDQRIVRSPDTVPGAGHPMASMLDNDRARTRRERTFVGGECAACEELLEHTLRGERVLQFSCGHVAHEACFYEYIKESDAQSQYCPTCDAPLGLDSFRGGSILDLSMDRPHFLLQY